MSLPCVSMLKRYHYAVVFDSAPGKIFESRSVTVAIYYFNILELGCFLTHAPHRVSLDGIFESHLLKYFP